MIILKQVKIKNPFYKIQRRFMQRAVAYTTNIIGTRLIPPQKLITIHKRMKPDNGYTVVETKKDFINKNPITGHNVYQGHVVTGTGKELPLHEQSHMIVRDNATGKDVGLLTSAKDPKKGNINIAPENVNGDVLPNGTPKPQQFRAYQEPRDTRTCKNVEKKRKSYNICN